MPKITFIGAGSTVFAKNLLGDILSYPELAASTISLYDIDPQRLRTSEVVAHKIAEALEAKPTIEATTDRRAAARRRRLRHQHDPGRRLQAGHRDRFRDSQEVRAAPDHRRHAGHRRHHARPAHHPRAAGDVPRHGGAVPGRHVPAIRQPDGDELLGHQPRQLDQDGRALPQRAGHRRPAGGRHRRPAGRDQLPLRRHQPHGVLPALRARRGGPVPGASARLSTRAACRTGTGCATRCCGGWATSSPSPASTSASTCPGSSSATGPT